MLTSITPARASRSNVWSDSVGSPRSSLATCGGFPLCPADACEIDPGTGRPIMPPGATVAPEPDQQLFSLREGFDHPVLQRYLAVADALGIEVCGIEFIESEDGRLLTYDVNTNTNYNASVEAVAPRSAPATLVSHLAAVADEVGATAS